MSENTLISFSGKIYGFDSAAPGGGKWKELDLLSGTKAKWGKVAPRPQQMKWGDPRLRELPKQINEAEEKKLPSAIDALPEAEYQVPGSSTRTAAPRPSPSPSPTPSPSAGKREWSMFDMQRIYGLDNAAAHRKANAVNEGREPAPTPEEVNEASVNPKRPPIAPRTDLPKGKAAGAHIDSTHQGAKPHHNRAAHVPGTAVSIPQAKVLPSKVSKGFLGYTKQRTWKQSLKNELTFRMNFLRKGVHTETLVGALTGSRRAAKVAAWIRGAGVRRRQAINAVVNPNEKREKVDGKSEALKANQELLNKIADNTAQTNMLLMAMVNGMKSEDKEDDERYLTEHLKQKKKSKGGTATIVAAADSSGGSGGSGDGKEKKGFFSGVGGFFTGLGAGAGVMGLGRALFGLGLPLAAAGGLAVAVKKGIIDKDGIHPDKLPEGLQNALQLKDPSKGPGDHLKDLGDQIGNITEPDLAEHQAKYNISNIEKAQQNRDFKTGARQWASDFLGKVAGVQIGKSWLGQKDLTNIGLDKNGKEVIVGNGRPQDYWRPFSWLDKPKAKIDRSIEKANAAHETGEGMKRKWETILADLEAAKRTNDAKEGEFTRGKEGFRSSAYQDNDAIAIGYGHRLTDSELKSGKITLNDGSTMDWMKGKLSEKDAMDLFQRDYLTAKTATLMALEKSGVDLNLLSETQKDMLVDMGYNTGHTTDFPKKFPKLTQALKEGDFYQAQKEMRNIGTTRADTGETVSGLVDRANERSLAFGASKLSPVPNQGGDTLGLVGSAYAKESGDTSGATTIINAPVTNNTDVSNGGGSGPVASPRDNDPTIRQVQKGNIGDAVP